MHSRRVSSILIAAVAALGALGATRAAADVDVEVPLALNARGTLMPEGELETYRFFATKGTSLSFAAVTGRRANLAFAVHLFDPADVEVAIPIELLKITAKKLSVTKLPLTTTGAYRLTVSGTGTGEYTLTLSGKPQAKFGATLTVPAAGTAPFPFSAHPGSRLTFSARPARGSQATPRFGFVTGDGVNTDLSTLTAPKPTSHTVVLPSVGGTGDLSVDVTNPGADGDVTVSVTVRPPRVKPLKLDTRGAARGRPYGGESVVLRTVGAAGGTVEVVDPASDLLGAKVVFPAGTFAGNTTVTIASAPPLKTHVLDQAAGPAVFFGPSGVPFGAFVTVSLPYDPASIPVGQTPQDLDVLVVESDGSSDIFEPTGFDEQTRTVTVDTNGFSVCVPVARVGQQPVGVRPGGDEFWLLGVDASLEPEASQDSRRRRFGLEVGEVSFQAGGVFQISASEREFTFANATSGDGQHLDGNLAVASDANELTTTWAYGTDGQSVVVAGDEGPVTLAASRDGNYYVARGVLEEFTAESIVLVRKNATPLTTTSLAGKYNLVFWSVDAGGDGAGSGVHPRMTRAVGTMTLDAAGRFTITGSQRESDLTASGVPTSRVEPISETGTYAVDVDGAVLATIPPSGGDGGVVFRLLPGPGAAVMMGTDKDAPGDANLQVILLFRQGTNLSNATATGAYRGVEFDLEQNPYTAPTTSGPGIVVADFEIADSILDLSFSGAGSITVTQTRRSSRRETLVAGGVLTETEINDPFVVSSKIDRFGKFTVTYTEDPATPVGAVSIDGMFGCGVSSVAASDGSNSLLFFVKPPPVQP